MLKQEYRQFGVKILPDNRINFNLWAPDEQEVRLCLKQQDNSFLELPMERDDEGWFSICTELAQVGMEYMFKLSNSLMVPDPVSYLQTEDVHGPSVVFDHSTYDWGNDVNWKGRPWEETVLYEIHTGTFAPEGTFAGIKNRLDYLVSIGVTAIELMPVADFPGKWNWGYDGVLLFAPDTAYGSPDELKDLIKAAHEKGLMVFLDVVYNHFGPDGNYLYCYAKSSFFECKHSTPWGCAINFENKLVREFYIQNALFWLETYHFDGLRFDAVHEIKDDSPVNILEELAQRVREAIPDRHIHLVLENDDNVPKFLERKPDSPGYYDAQWNDDFHHCIHILLTGEKGGYYRDYTPEYSENNPTWFLARALAEGYAYQGELSSYRNNESRGGKTTNLRVSSFVNFLQNHDQVGNRAFGERVATLTNKQALKAAICLFLLAPEIPLLFMGEEWGSTTNFLFFSNLSSELSETIREGRRREFSRFPEFVDPANREKIPDPTIESTFNASILDWNKQDAEMLDFYRQMIKTRKEHIVPLIPHIEHSKSTFEVIDEGCFKVKWFTNNGKTLKLTANLSSKEVLLDIDRDFEFNKDIIAKCTEREEQGKLAAGSVFWHLK